MNVRAGLCAVALLFAALPAFAGGAVVIPAELPMTDPAKVDPKAIEDCKLPKQAADNIARQLKAAGYEPQVVDAPTPKSGDRVLLISIDSAIAKGKAMGFTGRAKILHVSGRLYDKGKAGPSFTAMRHSRGGAFAGFKSSCAFYGRCAEALGEDIAAWLANPVDGAHLGDAR